MGCWPWCTGARCKVRWCVHAELSQQNWKVRWFRLVNGMLQYYYVVDEDQFRLKGSVNVAHTRIQPLTEDDYGKEHSFCVTSNYSREFLVAAAPTAEKQQWWVRILTHVSQAALQRTGTLEKRMKGLRKVCSGMWLPPRRCCT